jgi:hypothetical protein
MCEDEFCEAVQKFSLQAGLDFASLSAVRVFPPLLTLILLSSLVQAQEQERKLIDRLLRPDMTLQNCAQNKKFVTTRVALATGRVRPIGGQDRQVKTKKFAWQEKTKTFSGTREFPSRQIHSRSFNGSKAAAGLDAKKVWKSDLVFRTHAAANMRIAADADKKVIGRDFADNHPFRGQGKSQKALSQLDRPLTIEQVRELLNKNK